MKDSLVELITKISSGCLSDDTIHRIADEASQAYASPDTFLAANPDINYDETFPIALGEWVVLGSLPDTVVFQADTVGELLGQIIDSFGPGVSFNIKPKSLAKVERAVALNRVQIQMSSLSKDRGGYTLMNFSQLLDDELQVVLVYGEDVDRVLVLAEQLNITMSPILPRP